MTMPTLTVFRGKQRPLFASACCFLVVGSSALLLGGAAERSAAEGTLRVEPRIRDLGDLAPGVEIPIGITVTNLSGKPVKLLGISGFCVSWGCVFASDFPLRLAPHDSTTFDLHLRPKAAGFSGTFVADVVLFADAPGRERTPLRVTGNVVHGAER